MGVFLDALEVAQPIVDGKIFEGGCNVGSRGLWVHSPLPRGRWVHAGTWLLRLSSNKFHYCTQGCLALCLPPLPPPGPREDATQLWSFALFPPSFNLSLYQV